MAKLILKVNLVIMIPIFVSAAVAYGAIPAEPEGFAADATKDFCSSGGICALVCKKAPKDVTVSFSDFVQLSGNKLVSRLIVDRLGESPSEQLRQVTVRLVEANVEFASAFDAAMDDVDQAHYAGGVRAADAPLGCGYRRIAFFSRGENTFVIEKDLSDRLSETDKAGLLARLALERISKNPKLNSELVAKIFYGNSEDHDRIRRGAAPTSKSDRLDELRQLIDVADPDASTKLD